MQRVEILRLAAELISTLSQGEPSKSDVYQAVALDAERIFELALERARQIDAANGDYPELGLVEFPGRSW